MPALPDRVACVVLAAGAGTRFRAGTPGASGDGGELQHGAIKQLAPVGARTLLGAVLDNVRAVPVLHPVVCVLGAHADEIRAAVDFDGVDVVVADDWADGQSASLKAGVAAVAADGHAGGVVGPVLVVLGDQPGITPDVLAGVLDRYDPASDDAVRPAFGGVPGNPVLLGPRMLAHVPELTGDHGARELLRTARVRTWEAGHLCDPTDIDTPENLEAFAP